MSLLPSFFIFFFFNDTATTEIYTLSLHDALPIFAAVEEVAAAAPLGLELHRDDVRARAGLRHRERSRSEEHTSELQSRLHLVCRLLLEKKKKYDDKTNTYMLTTHSLVYRYSTRPL